jgi:hypothetical protein
LSAGCVWSGNLTAITSSKPCTSWGKPQGDRVVAADLDAVSQSTQDSLKTLGVAVLASKQGDDVRITGTSKAGNRFTFVLHRIKTAKGETTSVHVDWEKPEHARLNPEIVQVAADVEVALAKK